MADERAEIFDDLLDILNSVEGVNLVSEDYGLVLVGELNEFPAIFLLDLGDKVDEPEPLKRCNKRTMTLGITFILKASNRADARREMSLLVRTAKSRIYEHVLSVGLGDDFEEKGLSHLVYDLKIGPNVVEQGMQVEIRYIESINDLLAETL